MAKQRAVHFQWDNGNKETFFSIEMSLKEIKTILRCMELSGLHFDEIELYNEIKDILEKNK